jgi:hypothetical protein
MANSIKTQSPLSYFDAVALLGILKAAVADPGFLNTIRKRSHMHPIGFRKIVLVHCTRGHQIRLHRWDGASSMDDELSIHSHRWDFLSLVLTGSIINLSFVPVDGDYGLRKFSVGTAGPGERREAIDLGPTGVAVEDIRTYDAGQAYFQRAPIFHATKVRGQTGTLVLQDRAWKSRSLAIRSMSTEEIASPPLPLPLLRSDLLKSAEELKQVAQPRSTQ